MSKTIKVLLGSVRSQRAGKAVADWVLSKGEENSVPLELLDLKEWDLPFYDEPAPPMAGEPYSHDSTKEWSQAVDEADGFIIVTPEYNHGYSPVLKNALDHLYKEWKDKPVGFVGYGGSGAVNAINQLTPIVEFLGMKPVAEQVGISPVWEAFDEEGNLQEDKVSGDITNLFKGIQEEIQS
ncbi:MAG: NAD(P)H-dependent oxidoreductase [Spirochaetales bacterium]|nr:NAD(P)H-dependent oxidoreductase [Spirochaetales bacterium]